MAHYNVKSWPVYFQAIKTGHKKHDLRKMDRPFKVGDTLTLQEYDPFKGKYTGDQIDVTITYITSQDTPCAFSSAVLENGYAILSLDTSTAQKVGLGMGMGTPGIVAVRPPITPHFSVGGSGSPGDHR